MIWGPKGSHQNMGMTGKVVANTSGVTRSCFLVVCGVIFELLG